MPVRYAFNPSEKYTKAESECSEGTIEEVLDKATVRIFEHLKKEKISTEGKKFVYKTHGMIKGLSGEDRCNFKEEGYEEMSSKIGTACYWVTAMVLDEKHNYVISVSSDILHREPERFSSYLLDLKMIKLTKENDYLIFINFYLECREKYMLGYKKDRIDVYRYTDDDLIFLYSK